MAWWRARCPIRPDEQRWIDESMDRFVSEFGRARLFGTVVLPTDDFFPGTYTGDRADIRRVFELVCLRMGVDHGSVQLVHYTTDDGRELAGKVGVHQSFDGAAGLHQADAGQSAVHLDDALGRRPMALVAVVAHELGHVLLSGQARIDPDRPDNEPLTDLLTVYFGFGIFGANVAFDIHTDAVGERSYQVTSRTGYLTEPMFGYALARYAWLRGERDPDWAGHLDTNPRVFLRRGLRYLRAQSATSA